MNTTEIPKDLSGTSRQPLRGVAKKMLRNWVFGCAFGLSLLAIIYWSLIASDRYVSEAHVTIQSTDIASGQSMDFSSALKGLGGSFTDQYQLQDHLLSVDMLSNLDAQLDLRGHYSDEQYDVLSRLWAEDVPMERFHDYYLGRVTVDLNRDNGLLIVRAEAYTPEMAHAIASRLVAEGERYMNGIAHDLARVQVEFLEEQVVQLKDRLMAARMQVLDFQNRTGLVSPQGTTENLVGIIGRLEGQLADLQTELSLKQSYLVPDNPDIVEIKMQLAAIEKQIGREKKRLTSASGGTLNKTLEEYQRLQMVAEFALDIYKTALTALERGRIDATRTIKKISVLQSPTTPQYPLEPQRIYNSVVFILAALLLAGVINMLAAIIRDHQE